MHVSIFNPIRARYPGRSHHSKTYKTLHHNNRAPFSTLVIHIVEGEALWRREAYDGISQPGNEPIMISSTPQITTQHEIPAL